VRALVWEGPRLMEVRETAEPETRPGWVVVRPGAAGVCGSEVEAYQGLMPNRRPPLVMGHELAGQVIAAGPGVDGSWVGSRVAVNPIIGCGECAACRDAAPNLCPGRTLVGIQHPGGFAERVPVPVECLVPLPDGVDVRVGALVEPMANGVRAAGLALAAGRVERAIVVGAGMIGLACLQGVVLSGVPDVAVVEPSEARRALARQLGASRAFASLQEAEPDVDVVVDAVGTARTRRAAVELVRTAGACVLVGLHDDETPIPFHSVVRKSLTLRGSYAYTRAEFATALEWLAGGRAGIGDLTPVLPLEQGPEVFADLASGPSPSVKLFLGPA
jgi:(R,R)-butanediol dehydrogenase / meso-butanediol dehydrogenase / diacetyl reductase